MFTEFADGRWRHGRASARAVPVQFIRPAHGVYAVKNLIVRFVREEAGQDLIEYALIATFVSLVAAVGAGLLGTSLNNWYGTVSTNVNGMAGSAS